MYRKSLALLASFLLFQGVAPLVLAQESTASVAGVILNPSGQPAFGFRVILKDVASKTQYTSDPTDAAGNYSVQVPIGGRYKIDGVIADDGVTRLPVQEVAPVSVLAAGTTRLNVRFTTGATPGPATASTEAEKKKKKEGVPWYKRPGPIVGIVIGSAVVLALALGGGGGGGGNSNPSPSAP
jgi:hypothetical protein